MGAGESSDAALTSSLSWEVLGRTCNAVGLPSDGAKLLRLGENAIFRLGRKPLVVRIGRSLERLPIVEAELCVARWLDGAGVAVACPYDGVAQPMVIDQRPVSVWHLVERDGDKPGVDDLAVLLRQVHALENGPCALPRLDPFVHAEPRVRGAVGLAQEDRAFLLAWSADLRERFRGLDFVLPPGFVHGDAHTGNLLGRAGRAVLTDFEMAAIGPREWDLIPTAVSRARFGLAEDAYRRFVARYGFDVTDWAGFDVLQDIREFNMTAWLMQNLAEGQHIAAEVALRIDSIRDGDRGREWHAF